MSRNRTLMVQKSISMQNNILPWSIVGKSPSVDHWTIVGNFGTGEKAFILRWFNFVIVFFLLIEQFSSSQFFDFL